MLAPFPFLWNFLPWKDDKKAIFPDTTGRDTSLGSNVLNPTQPIKSGGLLVGAIKSLGTRFDDYEI